MGRMQDIITNEQENIFFEEPNVFENLPNEQLRIELYTGEKRHDLSDSIKLYGIIEPIIVMPSCNRGKLTIVSGHNRVDICKELHLKVPYRLKNLTNEEAELLYIESNLQTRQINEIKLSKLAIILKTRRDLLAHQGTSNQLGQRLDTGEQLSNEFNLSPTQIRRIISLNKLTDDFKKELDDGQVPFVVGYNLSFLEQDNQKILYDYLKSNNKKCTLKQSEKLKELKDNTLNEDILKDIFNKSTEEKKITIDKNILQYIPNEDRSRIKDIIIEALKKYYNK